MIFGPVAVVGDLLRVYRDAYVRVYADLVQLHRVGRSTVYSRAILNNIKQVLSGLDANAESWCETIVSRDYNEGVDTALGALGGTVTRNMVQIHESAVSVLVGSLTDDLMDAHAYVGRRVMDDWRRMQLKSVTQMLATGANPRQAKKEFVWDADYYGVTAFKDKSGAEWTLDNYADMVIRSVSQEAQNTGLLIQLGGMGHDLVQMTEHRSSCPLCAPYEGRVYSVSGNDSRYPPLKGVPGFDEGYQLMHPNCRHRLTPYVRGLDRDADRTQELSNRPFVDERTEEDKAAYARSQKMRSLSNERKKLEQVAAALPKDSPEYAQVREKLRSVRGQQQTLGREDRAWKEQAAAQNRTYYDTLAVGQKAQWPGRTKPSGGGGTPGGSVPGSAEHGTTVARFSKVEDFSDVMRMTGSVPPERGDAATYLVCERQGFSGKPHLVTEVELDGYIATGEREVYRGITPVHGGPSVGDMCEQFQSGDFYAGRGVYGNGTYVAATPQASQPGASPAMGVASYYAGDQGKVIRMTVKADAKVIAFDELLEKDWRPTVTAFREMAASKPPEDAWRYEMVHDLMSDLGRYAAMKGYDVIDVRNDGDYMVVLNRTAVRVQDTLLDPKWR